MAYYVGTKEFPSITAALGYLRANRPPGLGITTKPVGGKPAPTTKQPAPAPAPAPSLPTRPTTFDPSRTPNFPGGPAPVPTPAPAPVPTPAPVPAPAPPQDDRADR